MPGNHDEFARDYRGLLFGDVEVTDADIHETADGKKMLIIHGDQFDIVVRHARWLAFLGDWAYEWTIVLNTWFNRVRRVFGVGYWSFSAWAKLKVKSAVNFIGDFEETLAAEAARRAARGRWRRLRTYPSRHDPEDRWDALCEHRRFRGELHGDRGT